MMQIFLADSEGFSFSYNITFQICTFVSSVLEVWDYRLNYDPQSFKSETRMTKETLFNRIISGYI